MSPTPLSMQVAAWHGLMLAHERVMVQLRVAFKQFGLSVSEFDVLVNLIPGSPSRHSDLAERVVLSRTALTRLVDRLQRRGLVARRTDTADRRVVWIELTPEGIDIRRDALVTNTDIVESALSGLTAEQITTLKLLSQRIGTVASSQE